MEKVLFQKNDREQIEYYVLEQTTIAGKTYLLVTDTEEDDGEALILKETVSGGDSQEYTDDLTEEEFEAVLPIFQNLLEDIDFITT